MYPSWTNASDFRDTKERFGTVALHDETLAAAVAEASKRISRKEKDADEQNIDIDRVKLTRDQRYMAKATGTDLPFLPFPSGHRGERENKLFSRLILQSRLTDDEMVHEWAKHVDGIHIFPKLPVHIRIHREEWERNQRIRDALEKNRAGIGRLRELNAATNTRTNAIDAAATSNATVPVNAGTGEQTAWLPPQMPTMMPAPKANARSVSAATIVGGTRIGLASTDEVKRAVKKRHGDRGKDKQPRKKRRATCSRCQQHQPNEEERDPMCKGRGGSKHCEHYDEYGNIL